MLEYSTKGIDKEIKAIKREVSKVPDYGYNVIAETLEGLSIRDKNILEKYDALMYAYGHCAVAHFITTSDKEMFKGFCHLAAKAGEICFLLYEKGIRTSSSWGKHLEIKDNMFNYIHYAILANNYELAIRMTPPESLLGSVLLQDYDKAKKFLPEDPKVFQSWQDEERILWTIAYRNEKKLNQFVERRIKDLRRQASVAMPTYFDEWGLALIKLAMQRGMVCKLNVIELPLDLFDVLPVNEEEWKLPKDEELEKILAGGVYNENY
ncbi:MAG: hypothetical protein K2N34_04385 [Lachnospiraceae bacterium]|nr:hypothetical protein [Lachnospiraceae bacterium]